eukprot:s5424_g1.t2
MKCWQQATHSSVEYNIPFSSCHVARRPFVRLRRPQMSLQSARGLHDEGYFQDLLVAVGLAKSCTPRKHGSGTPMRGLRRIKTSGPNTHKLPFGVMWTITLITAVTMAVINFFTIWIISFAVEWKFNTLQAMVDNLGVWFAIVGFTGICSCLALCCTLFIFTCAPAAGGSGAPENKGFLNGNEMPELFTLQNLIGRAVATMLANVTGYPVGREGPTVTMGSNLAYIITSAMALPFVRQWVDVDAPGSATSAATMIDEDRFEHAKRIVCTVGGACGMAMLFDSPIGGIVYMFEEITSSAWPVEVTFRAFAGTCVCALLSRALLNMCGTSTKAFVVYEWNPQPQGWSWRDVPFFILLVVLHLVPPACALCRACISSEMTTQDINDWTTVCNGLRETEQDALWLDVLEAAYSIKDCQQALHAMPDFLGRFLVRDFEYKGFRHVLGHEVSDDGDEEFGAQLDADLQAAATLMLRLVMTIAKRQALQPADWQEASAACGKALRTLPSRYRLQRQLPGALNDARTLRYLEDSFDDACGGLNPLASQEGQCLFEGRHGISWSDVQALLAKDGDVVCSFSGPLLVQQLVHKTAVSIVRMRALRSCEGIDEGATVLWEVDAGLGSQLQQGLVIDGHWRLLESEFCFMRGFEWICPEWALRASESEDAVLIGPFSAFHTRACLAVASARQKLMTRLAAYQPYNKMADAVLYGGLVALTYSLVALSANCKHTAQDAAEFVRYDCEEGKYNPVASLLLTTSEGAVKRLFSRHDANEIHFRNELLAFVSYTSLNIGLTGVPVPSGNFTGSMLIGGLIGRMMGALVRDYGKPGMAVSGVYAMVGSASMLAGFKQMAVAVVVFITGAANDLGLVPPLMLAVTISLLLNKLINERGFDEEQILRKAIAYLPAEPPRLMDRTVALELCDDLPPEAVLAPEVDFRTIQAALQQDKVDCFPVLKEGGHCIGFTTRARLQAATEVWQASGFMDASDRGAASSLKEAVSDGGGEQMGKLVSAAVARESSFTGTVLPVKRLTERAPYTILEDSLELRGSERERQRERERLPHQ